MCFTSLAFAQVSTATQVVAPVFKVGDVWKFKYVQDSPDQGWYRESVESVIGNEASVRVDDSRNRRFIWTFDVPTQTYLRFFAYSRE